MARNTALQTTLSYKLYAELVEELTLPLATENPPNLELQYELYHSKLTYLYLLQKQENTPLIAHSIEITRTLIVDIVNKRLKESLSRLS